MNTNRFVIAMTWTLLGLALVPLWLIAGKSGVAQTENSTTHFQEPLDGSYSSTQGALETTYGRDTVLRLGQPNGGSIMDVSLILFTATPSGTVILVEWETATEVESLGFNLWRAESSGGPWTKLNADLIPSLAPPGSGATYLWTDENVQIGIPYHYKLEAVSTSGGSKWHGPIVVDWLTATNNSPTALGDTTTLTATGPMTSYTWIFGDGYTGTGALVTHTYTTVAVYTAIVTTSYDSYLFSDTTSVAVEQAVAGLSVTNDSPTARGEFTTFTATLTEGSSVTYTWAFGDGEWSVNGPVISHTYSNIGVYTATVAAFNKVSKLDTSTVVTITDMPIVGLDVTNDSPTALGGITTLTATITEGSSVTYTWAFGDGATGVGAVVHYTYSAVSVYTAIVTAYNSVSLLTETTTVTITRSGFDIYLPLIVKQY